MMDVWPISWSHSSRDGDGAVGLVEWLLKLTVSLEPAAKTASSKCFSWWFLSSLIIFRACSSLIATCLCLALGSLLHPVAPSALAVFSSPLSLQWLWSQPLGLLWPATEFEEWSSQTSSFTGSCRHWTLWRKDFWCFLLLWGKGKQAN